MNCEIIEGFLNRLKVDSLGRIRNKSKVIDQIHVNHLTDVDKTITDIRLFVARVSTGLSTKDALKEIDEYLYQKQTKQQTIHPNNTVK